MSRQRKNGENGTLNSALWLAGATGAAVAVATWAYSRRKPTYWDRARRGVQDFAETATDQYRKASKSASKAATRTSEQARPWLATCAKTTLMLLGAWNEASKRKPLKAAQCSATKAVDRLASAASEFSRRVPQYMR